MQASPEPGERHLSTLSQSALQRFLPAAVARAAAFASDAAFLAALSFFTRQLSKVRPHPSSSQSRRISSWASVYLQPRRQPASLLTSPLSFPRAQVMFHWHAARHRRSWDFTLYSSNRQAVYPPSVQAFSPHFARALNSLVFASPSPQRTTQRGPPAPFRQVSAFWHSASQVALSFLTLTSRPDFSRTHASNLPPQPLISHSDIAASVLRSCLHPRVQRTRALRSLGSPGGRQDISWRQAAAHFTLARGTPSLASTQASMPSHCFELQASRALNSFLADRWFRHRFLHASPPLPGRQVPIFSHTVRQTIS